MLKKIASFFAFLSFLALPAVVFAQTAGADLNAIGAQAGLGEAADLPTIIGRVIYVLLSLVGIVLLGFLLYAGYTWMTAGGDPKKVDEAKTTIRNAIVGLIIIASSYAITAFVINALSTITSSGGIGGTSPFGSGVGFPSSAGSLGGGIIESHIPQRDATGVPRNTQIVITFKEPINPASFIAGWTVASASTTVGLNGDAVKIYQNGQRDHALASADARVRYTEDHKTFVIKPVAYLGSPTADTDYTVELLSGASGIRLEDGSSAFSGAFSSGYKWGFQVSTVIDNTPPKVISVIPTLGGTYAPNIVVQVNFSEPVDPTSASGLVHAGGSGFQNMRLSSVPTATPGASPTIPSGEYRISNEYRTVEFTTDLACGTNSCGRTVYCLPTDANIDVLVKSATLSDTPPQAFLSGFGYDGVTDMVGNSLDGNGDGIAQGSPTDAVTGDDNYEWTFGTAGSPNLAAPRMTVTTPTAGDLAASSNLAMDFKPDATFDSVLQASTVNSDNVVMQNNEPLAMADTFWWSLYQDNLTAAGAPLTLPTDIAAQAKVTVKHRLFEPATSTAPGAITPVYQPVFKSGLQNVYQNCFNPAASAACDANSSNPNCCDGHRQSGACTAPTHAP